MQSLLYENEFYLQVNKNSFSYEKFSTYTHFETEAKGKSEMAYSMADPKVVKATFKCT